MRKSVNFRPQKRPTEEWGLYAATGGRKYLTAEERRRFLAAAEEAAAPAVTTLCLTLAYCGCRLSEALALTAADIQADCGVIAIRSLKKRGRWVVRQVPAPPYLFVRLTEVHGLRLDDERATRPLWPSWGRTRAWQLIKKVMASAGVSRLPASPKGLRHGYGVHAVLSGVPLHLVQRWLGHQDIRTTAIYTHVLGHEEREIAGRMW